MSYDPDEIGKAVNCRVCGLRKLPIGRAAPLAMANSLCDHECPGYRDDPWPGSLWPGERMGDFRGEEQPDRAERIVRAMDPRTAGAKRKEHP